jgi:hypothetical protein
MLQINRVKQAERLSRPHYVYDVTVHVFSKNHKSKYRVVAEHPGKAEAKAMILYDGPQLDGCLVTYTVNEIRRATKWDINSMSTIEGKIG